jgi:hypothetical protein
VRDPDSEEHRESTREARRAPLAQREGKAGPEQQGEQRVELAVHEGVDEPLDHGVRRRETQGRARVGVGHRETREPHHVAEQDPQQRDAAHRIELGDP